MNNMQCPYCEKEFDYDDQEPKGEDELDETECPNCEKMFVFTRSYSVSYSEHTADCLNGAPHVFRRIVEGLNLFRCVDCDKRETRKE